MSARPLHEQLQNPFPPHDVEWRIGRSGITNGKVWATCLAYLTNRAIQERLDAVFGVGGWQNAFQSVSGGWLCGISCLVNGERITKWDGAPETKVEALKGGLSDAMKRAAVQWGIGRYLYALPEGFAKVHDKGRFRGIAKDKSGGADMRYKWDPPDLPKWALPQPLEDES